MSSRHILHSKSQIRSRKGNKNIEFLSGYGASARCIEWPYTYNCGGYGRVSWWDGTRAHNSTAHRVAYVLRVGDIPPGMQLDHTCRNTRCVNVAHLEPVDARTNTARGIAPAAATIRMREQSGTCAQGHEWVDGWEACRECSRAHQRERDRRVSAAREALGLTHKQYTATYGRSGLVALTLVGHDA